MPVIDAHVRIRHPCPYCNVSVAFPRSLLLLWCDNRRDTFLVSSPEPDELRRVLRRLRSEFRARPLIVEGSVAIVVVPEFEWADPPSVTRLARRAGVWVLPPVLYSDGRETYRMIASGRPRLNRFVTRLRRLGDVELLSVSDRTGLESVRDVPSASVHFFEGLTDRQTRSMVAAIDAGLFDVPARSRFTDVARREGLSRSTFGEHVRKAQLRIARNSYASLKARMNAVDERTMPDIAATSRAGLLEAAPHRGRRLRGSAAPRRRHA